MSTKGSYRFKDKFNDIIIHKVYDNHPQSAARILSVCLYSGESHLGDALHRQFEDTTIISNREAYADEEFRYDIHETSSDTNIKAFKRDYYNNKIQWSVLYEGNLKGFLNEYYEEQ